VIETLPPAPPRGEEPAARRSWLRLLLAPEKLPHDLPAAPPRPRARWLAWLFAPEKLDR